jgi:hypothetical protein
VSSHRNQWYTLMQGMTQLIGGVIHLSVDFRGAAQLLKISWHCCRNKAIKYTTCPPHESQREGCSSSNVTKAGRYGNVKCVPQTQRGLHPLQN